MRVWRPLADHAKSVSARARPRPGAVFLRKGFGIKNGSRQGPKVCRREPVSQVVPTAIDHHRHATDTGQCRGQAFQTPLFLPYGTQNTAEQGRHTAPDALESAFGCRLRSAGELLGVDGPAKMRRPVASSTGYPLPSGRLHRSRNHSDAADPGGSRIAAMILR